MLVFLLSACSRDVDHDGSETPADCNDADPDVFPGAPERCNTADDDCDGAVDEDAVAAPTWYADADGDGQGTDAAVAVKGCVAPAGAGAKRQGDCDDAEPTVFAGAPEEPDGKDDDCDGRIDEEPIDEGLVFITEVVRQPRFGKPSLVSEGQWFEVQNAGWREVDLRGAWVVRSNAESGTDRFQVRSLRIPAGGRAVFCKSDLTKLPGARVAACDYVWGDASESPTWTSVYQDNTFNLQRDTDTLALYVGGDETRGRLVDRVAWSFAAGEDWPREATHAMVLDPAAVGAAANDIATAWCTAAKEGPWWWAGGAAREYGSPGAANPGCGG